MGGGKTGGQQTQKAAPITTRTGIGALSELSKGTKALDESKEVDKGVDTKKLGTRGLRIPLATDQSSTKTAANTGVQV